MSTEQSTIEIAQIAARAAVLEVTSGEQFRDAISGQIKAALDSVGLDTNDPARMRRDLVQLREWNDFWDFVRKKGVGATVTWVVTGALASLAIGIGVLLGRS